MKDREAFGYVVKIEGSRITLNLRDSHSGQHAAHRHGISAVTEIGSLFGVDGGGRLLVLRVRALHFAEPREAHREGVGTHSLRTEPLRHLEGLVQGYVTRRGNALRFVFDSLISPDLGAEAYPLSPEELRALLRSEADGPEIELGREVRGGVTLKARLNTLLPQHVAVLGATGQGKSCFTAAVLQQLLELPQPRIVVFDINGEYEDALCPHVAESDRRLTKIGGDHADLKIPYYALGRHGLSRLLLPSERTQRPALNFALDNLSRVTWHSGERGAGLIDGTHAVLFEDCRSDGAEEAAEAIHRLRLGEATEAEVWPPMRALACLVAESHCLRPNRYGAMERNAFEYGNVAPLITRILRRVEDPFFQAIVDTEEAEPTRPGPLNWEQEASDLVDRIFGSREDAWKLNIVNFREVVHDLMPVVLASLLELLAFELFRRGQGQSYPTLLVLEEAHHYLRQVATDPEERGVSLAYERLAKEGRKFGLSLWISTQRPSEVSPTVLGQCGTWGSFRLTAEQDLRAIASASEWVDRQDLDRISGLPRQQMLVFGAGVPLAVRVEARNADPVPRSLDPNFGLWARRREAESVDVVLPDNDEDIPF